MHPTIAAVPARPPLAPNRRRPASIADPARRGAIPATIGVLRRRRCTPAPLEVQQPAPPPLTVAEQLEAVLSSGLHGHGQLVGLQLASGGRANAREVAQACGISERSARRQLHALREAGALVDGLLDLGALPAPTEGTPCPLGIEQQMEAVLSSGLSPHGKLVALQLVRGVLATESEVAWACGISEHSARRQLQQLRKIGGLIAGRIEVCGLPPRPRARAS